MSVENVLRSLWASLCQLIYKLVAFFYELFMNVAKVKLLSQDDIKPIYQRVTLILAIVMIFYVTFEVVKYIISPDTISDKEKGASSIVKKMIIVVVLIAMVPTIFEKAYDIQNIIFENQLFSKIILGKQDIDASSYGRSFSADLFKMFYRIDDDLWSEEDLKGECEDVDCNTVVDLNISTLADNGDLPFIHMALNEKDKNKRAGDKEMYFITFDGLLAVLVGGFVCWILIMYIIDTGTRIAQLAFLQIISPIPIIGYLSPQKEGMFQKWYKQCFATYISLFLRIAIIYVILLLCEILGEAYHSGTLFYNIGNQSFIMRSFMYIALILGLLAFGKRAPKMLEELFPKLSTATGDIGLSAKDRIAPAAARAIGMGLGATAGLKHMVARGAAIRKRNKMLTRDTGLSREERKENVEKARGKRSIARSEYRTARGDYKRAIKQTRKKGMTKAELAAAQTERDEAKQRLKAKQDALVEKESAYADAQKKKNRSVLGNAAAGLVGGTLTGAKTGLGAKEAKDIWNKGHVEANKANQKNLNDRVEWLNSGGYSNVQRAVSKVEQKMGIPTAAAITEREIKYYEGKIKGNEALISRQTDVKKKVEDSKSVAVSKLEAKKLDIKVAKDQVFKIKGTDGKTMELTIDEDILGRDAQGNAIQEGTLSEIYAKFEKDADYAKNNSAAANESLETLKAEREKMEAMGASADDKDKMDDAIRKQEEAANEASRVAVETEDKRKKMKDALGEYAMSYALKHPNEFDADGKPVNEPAIMATVEAALTSIEEARRDSKTCEEMEKSRFLFRDPDDPSKDQYKMFMGEVPITEYSDLDAIQKALKDVSDALARENVAYQGSKARLELSDAYAAQRADDTASKPQ